MLSAPAKVALKYFLLALYAFSISEWFLYYSSTSLPVTCFLLLIEVATVIISLKLFQKNNDEFQISIRATLLGVVFALGLFVALVASPQIHIFGIYMCVMATFHFGEYFVMAIIRPDEVSTDSFVINHSPQYIVAAVTSWLEFFVECHLFPDMKQVFWIAYFGLALCVMGEVLRKTAMITAGANFHHLVQCEKSPDHQLVTSGVYSLFRHPSYVGWFYWSIGTQLLLLNPLCVPAYALASWFFFKSRVYIEEITLLNFFGQSYCDYQTKVGTGLPFIDGYRIK